MSDVETVERFIPAPPEAIFEYLADPRRHQEIDGSGTVREGTLEEGERLELGSTFGMSMKLGVPYAMESEVIEFEEGRRIAWQSRPPSGFAAKFVGGRIWRYELEPRDGGTLVRESWDISQERIKPMVWPYRGKAKKSMTQTLARIEELVAPAASS